MTDDHQEVPRPWSPPGPIPPAALYAWYTDRGETGNRIKDLKLACFADRLSCHRFLANLATREGRL